MICVAVNQMSILINFHSQICICQVVNIVEMLFPHPLCPNNQATAFFCGISGTELGYFYYYYYYVN